MSPTDTPQRLTPVRAGFIPLVDCAVLAVAREKGFAAAFGIDLQLIKEVSWANVRDHINVGLLDVAHMLAGMPIAANLGIGPLKVTMVATFALSAGGNAITLGHELYDELADAQKGPASPMAAGEALRRVVRRRHKAGRERVSFAMVFPFSCHNYQLRYWMAAAGVDPDRDVRLSVIPPPYMVDSLQAGHIDGFCVGEPWNALAADQGMGKILMPAAEVWPRGPEKVLGMRESWAENNRETLQRLHHALEQAARWADDPTHHAELARLLAQPEYLGVSEPVVQTALRGDLRFYRQSRETAENHGAPIGMDGDYALWLYAQMVRWGQVALSDEAQRRARQSYCTDVSCEATAGKMAEAPPIIPPLDETAFDPEDVEGYIEAQAIKMPNL